MVNPGHIMAESDFEAFVGCILIDCLQVTVIKAMEINIYLTF